MYLKYMRTSQAETILKKRESEQWQGYTSALAAEVHRIRIKCNYNYN